MKAIRGLLDFVRRSSATAFAVVSFFLFSAAVIGLGHIEYRHQREEAEAAYQYDPTEEAAKLPPPDGEKAGRIVLQGVPGESRSTKLDRTVPSNSKSPDSADYHPHCDAPADRDTADLCAQWAAVNGVRVGNGLAVTGLYFTWIGMILSLVVGALTIIGVFLASRAAELASRAIEAMAKVDRAYLHLSARHRRGAVGIDVENCGNSPATVVFRIVVALDDEPIDALSIVEPGKIASVAEVIAAGKTYRFDQMTDRRWLLVGVGYRDVFDIHRLDWRVFERLEGKWHARKDGEHEAAYLKQRYHEVFPFP